MKDDLVIVGIDPGLVHTGMVCFGFDSYDQRVAIRSHLVSGLNVKEISAMHRYWAPLTEVPYQAVIEGYRTRSNFNQDARMIKGVGEIKNSIPSSKVLDNMGIKKIVTQPLMELLKVWKFNQISHHQDLRSAARIALLWAFKDPLGNQLVADFLRDYLEGDPWDVNVN